jgi:hypothetical protein
MTKKRGSKKGQKWPKMGVQKRVKKGSKIEFFEPIKNVTIEKQNNDTNRVLNKFTIRATHTKMWHGEHKKKDAKIS